MSKKNHFLKRGFFIFCLICIPMGCVFTYGYSYGETLFFEDVIAQVIAKSYDVEIAKIDKKIKRHRRSEALAEYLPSINVRLTDEYYKDLTEPEDTVIHTDITGYRNSLSIYADYNLFDFGAREMRYINASRDFKIAKHNIIKQLIDTKITALGIFQNGLTLSKRIKAQTSIVKYKTKIYNLSKRLYKAGKIGKIDLTETAIMVAESVQDLDNLQLEWEKALQELTCYTGKSYDADQTDFYDFPEPKSVDYLVDINNIPEVKICDFEIKKKETEFKMMATEWLPKFSAYSSYQFYSYDPYSFPESIDKMKEEEYRIGLKVDLNVFNGFGDFAKARRLRAELQKLKVEREKIIAEQKQLISTLKNHKQLYRKQTKKWEKQESHISKKGDMDQRLAKYKIRDQLYYLRKQIEETEKRRDLEINNINRIATYYHLQFIGEGGGHPYKKHPPKPMKVIATD